MSSSYKRLPLIAILQLLTTVTIIYYTIATIIYNRFHYLQLTFI